MKFDLNQGIKGGKYSILKIFHHPNKVNSMLKNRITSPLYVRIKIINRCCHQCFYCVYNPKFSKIHPLSNRVDDIPIKKMMEILDNLKSMRVKAVTYTGGGEPLSYQYIEKVLEKTIKNKIRLSMITNGQLLEGRKAELLYNADWIRASLDYHDAKTFSKIRNIKPDYFYKLINNLSSFAKNKNPNCDFGVNCVVHHLNYKYLFEIAKLCKKIGVDNLRFAPLWKKNFLEYHKSFKNKAVQQIEKAKKLQDKNISIGSTYERYFEKNTGGEKREYPRCFYMEIVPVIAADQNVYTCHNNAYEPSGKIGSIKMQSFRKMWFSPKTTDFFKKFNPQETCTHECSNDEKNRVLNEFVNCQEKGAVEYI